MLPYNEKIWKTPAEEMSLEWVDRVPRPPLLDLIKTGGGHPDRGLHAPALLPLPEARAASSRCPSAVAAQARGQGHDRLSRRLAPPLRGRLGRESDHGRGAALPADHRDHPHHARSSRRSATSRPRWTSAARRSATTRSAWRSSASGRRTCPAYTALYVPDPASLYHRVCYNQVFSPDMVPAGHSSVSCEITVSARHRARRLERRAAARARRRRPRARRGHRREHRRASAWSTARSSPTSSTTSATPTG